MWDGKHRRATDHGKELPELIWARIDERVNRLLEDAGTFKKDLIEHKKDDDERFKEIDRTIWKASGALTVIVSAVVFIINFIFKK